MTLNEARPGMMVKIEQIENSLIKGRLMSMGIINGAKVKVLRSAPCGDPMAVSVRSAVLALRLADASKIKVSKL